VRGRDVFLKFKYAVHVTPGIPAGQLAPATRAQLMALEGSIRDWLTETTSMVAGGKPCRLAIDNLVGPDRNMDLEVFVVWTCDVPEVKGLRIGFHPLNQMMNDWQTIASLKIGGQTASTVFTPDAKNWQVGEVAPQSGAAGTAPATNVGSSTFGSFFRLGVHHIWTGYDHLLFLLAVLLAGGGVARLAAIVTSFTIAHSITLAVAATGLVQLPVAPVEIAIALSIVAVAVENMLNVGADRRALVTFGFGLIHGFGFASVMAASALPTGGLVVPLVAFNLGVEAAQLVVVLAVAPVLALILRSHHARRIKFVLSGLIALAGAMWAVERIAAIVGIGS